MGSQIRFYMVDEDEVEFLRFLRGTGDIVLPSEVQESARMQARDSFPNAGEGLYNGFGCVFWNRDISSDPKTIFVPAHGGRYVIEKFESEVVEAIPCLRHGISLSLGRFFIETRHFDQDGNLTFKNRKLITWYDGICRWIRKNYERNPSGDFLSARVVSLVDEGLTLVGHCV